MKKYITFLPLLWLLLVVSSCEDFLTEEAFDTYTTDNFPRSASDAEALVNQMYRDAGEIYGNRLIWLAELPSEMTTTRRSGSDRRAQLDNYTVVNTNDYNAAAWADSYETIKQANAVIAFYEGGEAEIEPELAARLTAEAKVIRANTYFNLVTFWGDVPLVLDRITDLEGTANPINPMETIYEAMVTDLLEAEVDLPHAYTAAQDQGRATRGAARALLGKIYLQRGAEPANVGSAQDFVDAENWLRKVVTAADGGKSYILEPKFRNLFGLENVESSKYSDEIVFQLWRDGNDCCDNPMHQHVLARDANDYGSVRWGNLVAEVPFYLSYDRENDERFAVTFLDTIETTAQTFIYNPESPLTDGFQHNGVPYAKYVDPNSPDASGGNNIFLIRYADVLLMLSEAINRQNGPTAEALDLLNQVRNRAGLPNLEPEPTTQAEMNEALYNERRWELAFEMHGLRDGHRFFDIFEARVEASPAYEVPDVPPGETRDGGVRDDAVPEVPIDVTLDNIRFPIPLEEIITNPEIEG